MSIQKPAYLMASSIMSEGHGPLEPYGNAVHEIFHKAGAEILVMGSSDQHLEGTWANNQARFKLFRFPSMKALPECCHSPEYQSVKHLRTNITPPQTRSNSDHWALLRRLGSLFSAQIADFILDPAENTDHIIRILCGVNNVYLGKTRLADTHVG